MYACRMLRIKQCRLVKILAFLLLLIIPGQPRACMRMLLSSSGASRQNTAFTTFSVCTYTLIN